MLLNYELASENLDNGKSILGAPPKQDKKDVKNPKAKKANSQKPKQKKQHLCHHCGVASHTRPNYYKWLATQQSIWKPKSTSILCYSSWRSSQSPHVPFELEQF